MAIKIGSKIQKLNPTDTYKLVDGADVDGFAEVKTKVDQQGATSNALDSRVTTVEGHLQTLQQSDTDLTNRVNTAEQHLQTLQQANQSVDASLQVMRSDITQKISGIHVEDIGNHAFDDINSLHFIGATVSDDGSQQATITIDQQKIDVSNGQTPGSTSVTVENLEFPGAYITTRNNGAIAVVSIPSAVTGVDVTADGVDYPNSTHIEFENFTASKAGDKLTLTPPPSGGGSANLVIDDGTMSVGGVTKINLSGAKVTNPAQGEVAITPELTFENIGDSDTLTASTVSVAAPLKFEPPNSGTDSVVLTVDPMAYERQHAAGYLAYLADDTVIIGKSDSGNKHRGALWFEDTIVNALPYIQLVRDSKLIGIQEYDGRDPNVTGGQNYLVALRVSMKGTAPEDGFVRVYLNEYNQLGQDSGILTDVNGQPMAFERNYKAGDKLGVVTVVGIVNATGIKYFSCNVEDTFADAYMTLTDPTEGVSGVMVQAITQGEKTGPALLQFEADTNQDISFSSHYLGAERVDFEWLVRSNDAPVNIPAGVGLTMSDGYGIYNVTPLKFGTVNNHLVMSDNGSDIADFNLHRIFSAEETQMMRGKQIDVSITLTNKDMAFRVALMKWIGTPDLYTVEIFKTRSNDTINLQPNWVTAGELFVPEEPILDDHTVTKQFTVPSDANNYALMIYPINAQQPLTLELKDLRADVTTPFTGYVLHFSEMDHEKALAFSEQHKTLYQDNQGYAALRYTINGNDQPMPIGELGKGEADVSIDPTLNTIAGTMARGGEGGLEFKSDGKITVTTALRLWSEKATTVKSNVKFWYELVDVGQQRGTKINASEGVFVVHGGAQAVQYYMPTFSTDVTAGQRMILRVTGDGPDCAFLQSVSPSAPMLYTTITFDEFTSGTYDDPFADIDMSQFTDTYPAGLTVTKDVANVASVVIPVDVPNTANLVILGAIKQMPDTSVRPVAKLDWSYSNATKRLTVSFGETVLAGRVTLGLYL